MTYTEMARTTARHEMSVADFLNRNDMVKQQAGDETPADWLAGEFLPVADPEEGFEAWVCRQAADVLNAALRHDTLDGECRRVHRSVFHAAFDAEDRAYLLRTLGRHPGVQGKWRAAHSAGAIAA